MNTAAHTAHADQLHAEVRDARCCDALDPCADCQGMTRTVVAIRHAERVAAMRVRALIPAPRMEMLHARLAAVVVR